MDIYGISSQYGYREICEKYLLLDMVSSEVE